MFLCFANVVWKNLKEPVVYFQKNSICWPPVVTTGKSYKIQRNGPLTSSLIRNYIIVLEEIKCFFFNEQIITVYIDIW